MTEEVVVNKECSNLMPEEDESEENSILIKKILCEMKTKFNQENKDKTIQEDENQSSIASEGSPEIDQTDIPKKESTRDVDNEDEAKLDRRSRRFVKKQDNAKLKRSSRRTSRESVLQCAIARKEKSFRSLEPDEKPQRRSMRLSPGGSTKYQKTTESDSLKMTDSDENSTDEHISEETQLDDTTNHSVVEPPIQEDNNISSQDLTTEINDEFEKQSTTIEESNPNEDEQLGENPMEISNDLNITTGQNDNTVQNFEACLGESDLLCTCEALTSLYGRKQEICQAVDSYENKHYLCSNKISSSGILLQPSAKIPYLQFCTIHIQRMFAHNLCANCGIFCTKGMFNLCTNHHSFHENCAIIMTEEIGKGCPHCGVTEFSIHSFRLKNHKYPLILPVLKLVKNSPARITMKYFKYEKNEEMKFLKLPNNISINTSGLPSPEKEMVQKLVNTTTAHPNARNFNQAAKSGDADKILVMLASGFDVKREEFSLHAAASGGHLIAVHVLIQAGANANLLDRNDFTPLMLAAMNGHNKIVKYLVNAGTNLLERGVDGMTALHLAAKLGNLEGVEILLSSQNCPDSYVNTLDDGSWTPLVWAAENNHSHVVRYLLRQKADPQIRDSEMNIALHWSAFAGSMEITEDLLNYGSNVNLSNVHGDTPLHIAARQAVDDCVLLLLAKGARTDVVNKAGQYPKNCVLNQDSYCYSLIELNVIINQIKVDIRPIILSNDVSRGRENIPIQCINSIDNEPLPNNYTYITENCFTSQITINKTVSALETCVCDDMCMTNTCLCGKLSRKCWYTLNGILEPEFNYIDPPMLFECNMNCNCDALLCKNRVIQKGIRVRLEMTKTKDKSWGITALAAIPKGTYVCEYIGEIISDLEADTREDDSYLFDLDNREGGESYCLDARNYGNIARFINHSCSPNLAPVRVFIGHQDLHFPRIAFFAARDIEPHEELGYDYGQKFWVIKGKTFTCQCNEETCKYSKDTIEETLARYNKETEIDYNDHFIGLGF